jgi:hypothetical protein
MFSPAVPVSPHPNQHLLLSVSKHFFVLFCFLVRRGVTHTGNSSTWQDKAGGLPAQNKNKTKQKTKAEKQ